MNDFAQDRKVFGPFIVYSCELSAGEVLRQEGGFFTLLVPLQGTLYLDDVIVAEAIVSTGASLRAETKSTFYCICDTRLREFKHKSRAMVGHLKLELSHLRIITSGEIEVAGKKYPAPLVLHAGTREMTMVAINCKGVDIWPKSSWFS